MQDPYPFDDQPQRNRITKAMHRSEMLWQVILPTVVGFLLVAFLAVLLARAEVADASQWADVSLIWLVLPVLLLGLIPLAILGALIYLVTRLLAVLPIGAFRLQKAVIEVEARVRIGTDKAADPIIRLRGARAALRSIRRP